jgi:MFS family permease
LQRSYAYLTLLPPLQIPATLTDRYARLKYGYNETAICRHHHHHDDDPHSTNQTDPDETLACEQGSRAAESAAAMANFVTYGLSMVANPWIGTYSDVHGRRPVLLFSLSLSCLPAVMFCLLVHIPTLPPVWYYVRRIQFYFTSVVPHR